MHIKRVRVKEDERLQGLTELAQPVSDLYYLGDFPALLDKPLVAIVGSRKVSNYGQTVTIQLATALARAGVVIVSGLALGVDSVAHAAALDAGGKTLAVLPAGLDRIYPANHLGLAKRIVAQGGALVSEYPAEQGAPRKYQFIARNRIIAALSQGVLIPEAATKSGSLHTASFALEQGIEVFAVPGNITSPTSEGTNNLIKTGAHPVTTAQDILEVLGIAEAAQTDHQPTNPAEDAILTHLTSGHHDAGKLLSLSKLAPAIFQQTLTLLEINGTIRQTAPGTWSLT